MNLQNSIVIKQIFVALFPVVFCASIVEAEEETDYLNGVRPFLAEKDKHYVLQYSATKHPKAVIPAKYKADYDRISKTTIIRDGVRFRIEKRDLTLKGKEYVQLFCYDGTTYYFFMGLRNYLRVGKNIQDFKHGALASMLYNSPQAWYQFQGLKQGDIIKLEAMLAAKRNFTATYITDPVDNETDRYVITANYSQEKKYPLPSEFLYEIYYPHQGKELFDHLHSTKVSVLHYEEGKQDHDPKLFTISSSKVDAIRDHDLGGETIHLK